MDLFGFGRSFWFVAVILILAIALFCGLPVQATSKNAPDIIDAPWPVWASHVVTMFHPPGINGLVFDSQYTFNKNDLQTGLFDIDNNLIFRSRITYKAVYRGRASPDTTTNNVTVLTRHRKPMNIVLMTKGLLVTLNE